MNRLPADQRAGTRLDWDNDNVTEVRGPGYKVGSEIVHGYIDHKQSVYQSGGEFSNFLYRREQLLTLAYSVWEDIRNQVRWIELIDHESNKCYRVSIEVARNGHEYNAGIGPRWGVPVDEWEVS